MTDYRIIFPHLHLSLAHVPKSFSVGGFTISLYGVVIAIGMVCGILLAMREAKRTLQNPEDYVTLGVVGIIVSVIGTRIYYVAFTWDYYKDHLIDIFNLRQGGLAIYGGVIGAVLTAIVFARIKKTPFFLVADTAIPSFILGQIIGRWGNFFNREAFGGYTDNLLAMQIPVSAVRSGDISSSLASHLVMIDGVPFIQAHPTFLYECLWNIGVLIIMLVWRKRKKFNGQIFLIYLAGYGIGRAWIESLRTDQLLIAGTQIPVSQLLSIIIAAAAICLILIFRTRAVRQKT